MRVVESMVKLYPDSLYQRTDCRVWYFHITGSSIFNTGLSVDAHN